MIDEVGIDSYSANKTTALLATPAWEGALHHGFDTLSPIFSSLPSFLKDTGYVNITTPSNTPFQKAFETELSCFEYLPTQPKQFMHFQQSMAIQRFGNWLNGFPIEEMSRDELEGEESEKVFFVDVGGGRGQQCVRLMEKLGEKVSGKIVLQDLKATVEGLKIEGVKVMDGDFWKPQTIQGEQSLSFFPLAFKDIASKI
jgi:demethylsterigmatocystin 6-O-methyltransferase